MGFRGGTPRRLLFAALCVGAGIACCTGSSASPQEVHANKTGDLKHLSDKLQRDMTEAQVSVAEKFKPNWVSLDTCGADTQSPWQCKRYHYELYSGYRMAHELSIYFYNDAGDVWKVNSWTMY